MPAIRLSGATTAENRYKKMVLNVKVTEAKEASQKFLDISRRKTIVVPGRYAASHHENIYYPESKIERESYRTAERKKVTEYQWAVYDLVLQIPRGRVATYKQVRDVLKQGSPRSTGSALKNNPFAPFVPCHRVIASDMTLGGYFGEQGTEHISSSNCSRKVAVLRNEGVTFDSLHGKLENKQRFLWRPSEN